VLVGGTANGRSLAPRVAARFRTGLTADCTVLEMSETTDLDQIRPAYGGNIMAHINTPKHRPQFATVRYKIFPIPPPAAPHGRLVRHTLAADRLASAIEVLSRTPKPAEKGIEEADVLVVCGRGVRRPEDIAMLRELAALLGGEVASTRAVVEAGWLDAKRQIGLSGRTVKPKLIVTCGVSGAIQFVAGMGGSETIVAINSDPKAPIFKVAHIALVGDLYTIVPELIARIKAKKEAK
jgi:electron transfer flavoprotein alpha subunit